ncbi:unnamed protein product [Chrysoparadoxa australica]
MPSALVLGANRGLGLEVTKGLVERGFKTIGTCRKSSPGLDAAGCDEIITGVDLTDGASVDKMVKRLEEKEVVVDWCVSVAGLFTTEEFGTLDYEANKVMYDVCALGPLRAFEALVNGNRLREGSRIGMVTSEGGSITLRTAEEGGANYGHHMSKASQNMMGRILAWDLKPRGISVVMLHPGFLKTEMTEHYSHLYEKFGAIDASEAVPGILEAIEQVTLETTGRFIAPLGGKGMVADFMCCFHIAWLRIQIILLFNMPLLSGCAQSLDFSDREAKIILHPGLGLGLLALEDPDSFGPFSEIPF